MAPWEPEGERYGPGTVIEGHEKRNAEGVLVKSTGVYHCVFVGFIMLSIKYTPNHREEKDIKDLSLSDIRNPVLTIPAAVMQWFRHAIDLGITVVF